MKNFHIQYIFRFQDNSQEVIDLYLDAQTLDLVGDVPEKLPSWTNLDFHQCPNCQLTVKTHPYCPVAAHLMQIVTICKSVLSYEIVHVNIVSPERIVFRETSAQKGVSSLMGLIMATSGCPHMGLFKPMARYHLPFASAEETVYRAASMYLLAQYFLRKEGKEADLELEGLAKIYYNIHIINKAMAERLQSISDKDSAVNALVLLDIFALTLPYAIEESLKEIRQLFKPYLTY